MRRFRWFSVVFGALAVGFMYEFARWEMENGASTVHPALVAFAIASTLVVFGGTFAVARAGRTNLCSAALFGLITGMLMPMALMHPNPGPNPVREVAYVFPSGWDWFLGTAIVFNFIFALLMVCARVPKGKMVIVNGRAHYGGERPMFLPWMRYSVEQFDEIPVKVELRCVAGTSIVCEAVLAPDVEWCRTRGVFGVNTARFREHASRLVTNIICCDRAAIGDTRWMCVGEVLGAIASVDVATVKGVADGVSFHCLRFTITAATAKTAA